MKKTCRGMVLLLAVLLVCASAAPASGLFPKSDDLFSVTMPDIRFAIGREADRTETGADGEQLMFENFTPEEYEAFGQYAKAAGLKQQKQAYEGQTLTVELVKDGEAITFTYNYHTQTASLFYPSSVRKEREKSEAVLSDSLLPAVDHVPMPSLGDTLHRYADSETIEADGSLTQIWNNVKEQDFEAFSEYLRSAGVTLQDYRVTDGVFSAVIRGDVRTFSFEYDPETMTASVTYPEGTYDSRAKEAETHYQQAMEYMESGRYQEAYKEFVSIREYVLTVCLQTIKILQQRSIVKGIM